VLFVPDAMPFWFLAISPLRGVGLSAPICFAPHRYTSQIPLQSLAQIPRELVAIPLSKAECESCWRPLRKESSSGSGHCEPDRASNPAQVSLSRAPVVEDGLAAWIRAWRSKDHVWQAGGGGSRGKDRSDGTGRPEL
jgi:hypothetical protein